MSFSSDRDELGDHVIEVLREGRVELTAIAEEVDEDIGPVFARVRRFVDEGVARSPRPGVYTLTETGGASPSSTESSGE